MDAKTDNGAGKCPFMHTNVAVQSNSDWWPNQLRLDILHQHSAKSDPMGADFDYAKAFAGLDVLSVGVTCPIDVLEARERSRGDRVLGRARGLAEVVHTFMTYDVTVDTGTTPTEECVAAILKAVAAR